MSAESRAGGSDVKVILKWQLARLQLGLCPYRPKMGELHAPSGPAYVAVSHPPGELVGMVCVLELVDPSLSVVKRLGTRNRDSTVFLTELFR